MAREQEAKYAAKHPVDTEPDAAIARLLEEKSQNSRVTCTTAHGVAEALGVAPADVGTTADLLELRIVECQMGLFGYSPEKRLVKAAQDVAPDLRGQLERLGADGSISCASCWRIAQTLAIPKMAVSAACESMGLKIKRCQLGAF
jgi:hypothetical protein